VSPSSASVAVGSSTPYTVSTTAVNGSTQTITLSVTGLPSGVSGSFSPATVTAGGSSTLTISASSAAVAGTTSFSVSGGTGDADLYVRRGSAPTTSVFDCRPFVNGNSETCTFNAPVAGSYFV